MKTKKTTLKEQVQTEILFKSRLKQKIFAKIYDYLEIKSSGFECPAQNISVL